MLAVQRSGFERAEIVVVVADDPTRAALMRLSPPLPLRVLDEERPGRFAARRQGIEAASGDLVLLLDSRISITPDALRFVSDRIEGEHDLPIWSAHFTSKFDNPYGRFWSVIIPLVWWRYYSEPRTTSFGLDDYDRFSKATTCFLAPRSLLLEAKGEFSSYYADTRERQRRHRPDPPAGRPPADQHVASFRLQLHRPRKLSRLHVQRLSPRQDASSTATAVPARASSRSCSPSSRSACSRL